MRVTGALGTAINSINIPKVRALKHLEKIIIDIERKLSCHIIRSYLNTLFSTKSRLSSYETRDHL